MKRKKKESIRKRVRKNDTKPNSDEPEQETGFSYTPYSSEVTVSSPPGLSEDWERLVHPFVL